MAAKTRTAIIHDIEAHMAKVGVPYGEWFVGTTDNPRTQLHTVHGVRASGDPCISRRAPDDLQAAEVEEYFMTVRKTKGKPGKKSLDHVFVYAYRTKAHTKP